MKKILAVLSFALATISFSQNYDVNVTDHTGMVGKMHHAAVAVTIELDKDEVKSAWKKRMKDFGKVEYNNGTFKIEQASIKQVSPTALRVLSKVETTNKGTRIWVSLNTGDGYVKSGGKGFNGVKNILEDFAKELYQEDIQRQIDDAQKALADAQKNQEKVVSTADQLEKDIQENEEEHIELEQGIEQNKVDQEAAVKNLVDMEKALEIVKGKLDQVK